ncbi:putative methyltransferase PMT2 [Abeliophyllum distichum]|uniref:Methyltransferase n=1 Tax=Abeliophyllum distichum TaxID=126358 RepID=A0ABD1PCE9_9LAMI
MKLKINKACDLSSISVLPPNSRRSSAGTSGPESLSIFGKSQAPMQLRSQQQQLQQSQQSFSHGVSSQHGLYSQFSQNSQEEALTNELVTYRYKKMEACVTPYTESKSSGKVAGGDLKPFPERLNTVPPRIAGGYISGVSVESFQEDSKLWQKHVKVYKRINNILDSGRYRNIMDMNAGLGSFAASIESPKLWVMNVMPTIAERDTLGVIYERGLIGIYHDWCEAFSTYPRTYDLIHASNLFTLYKNKCNAEDILIEMDRILRPEGAVILRDHAEILNKVNITVTGMRWKTKMIDHEDGPLVPEKILLAVKQYWVTGENNSTSTR